MDISPESVIRFWFEETDKKLWFNSTPEFDDQIRDRFEQVYSAAVRNELSHWENRPEGCLALVIVLDQFPLNMYRGRPESFGGEQKAREISRKALDHKFDEQLDKQHKAFLYLPFMHSENLADQDLSVSLYEKAGLTENLRFARHHREIVRQFGRFPHRNEILGRQNSGEEADYLNSDKAFLG